MKITYDPAKYAKTLDEREIDFVYDAQAVFAGVTLDFQDNRRDYGEARIITVGFLSARMMVVVWTPRGGARHIISMRKANEREIKKYSKELGQI